MTSTAGTSPDSRSHRIAASASNTELLREFEPVIHYTRGERFFPTDVNRYVQQCSLWAHDPGGGDRLLVRQDELTVDQLSDPRPAEFG
ncbi:MAG: hypothetical protein ACK2T0_04025, partial [Anaerolineales bacterium]